MSETDLELVKRMRWLLDNVDAISFADEDRLLSLAERGAKVPDEGMASELGRKFLNALFDDTVDDGPAISFSVLEGANEGRCGRVTAFGIGVTILQTLGADADVGRRAREIEDKRSRETVFLIDNETE